MITLLLSAMLAGTPVAPINLLLATPPKVSAPKEDELTIDDFFPEKPFYGKTARNLDWSPDGRYLAYIWNTYDDHGTDIWLYDSISRTSHRLTSIDMFAPFDPDTAKAKEKYRLQKEDEEKRKGMTDDEKKKLDEEKKKNPPKPAPDYFGPADFQWSHNSGEMLIDFKGDIYRLKADGGTPMRLTKTQDPEQGVQYTNDDRGFYFYRSGGVYRMRFDSPMVEQLNPQLPPGVTMSSYLISPDETKMMVQASRDTAPERPVTYISYRGRFAQALQTPRNVADDIFPTETWLYLYDLKDDAKPEDKLWQIFYYPASKEYGELSVGPKPWSPDSKKFVFSSFKRDSKDIDVQVADLSTRKVEAVYKDKHNGGSMTSQFTQPNFTPDGKKIVALLEKTGFRHPWSIDVATKQATELVKGDFEAYPVGISKDSRTVYVTADKTDTTRTEIYGVNIADGTMSPVSTQVGTYISPVVSEDGRHIAAHFVSWKKATEIFALDGGQENQITTSHPDTWKKVYKLAPTPFSFKNRHGDTIHGYMYLPPGYKRTDKRPLFMYTYGGPLGTDKDVVDGRNDIFNMYMAYKYGYITCDVDPRGMSGYGGAFESASWEQPGRPQVEDLCDAVTYLRANYGIDRDKVGINGWSFGGFQTQMCMYTAPDVFTLGIAGAGPTQWQNYNTWYTGGVIGYSHLGKPEDLDKYSLTKLAKNLKGYLMLLHGMEDTNVLFQDTVHVYQALLQAGKGPLVELVLDPTGNHGLGGDIKSKDRLKIYEGYLLRHWGPYKG